MDIFMNISKWISMYNNIILICISMICLIFLIALIILSFKLNKLNKKYNRFMRGQKGQSLETILIDYIDKVIKVEDENKKIRQECEAIKKNVKACIQKEGIVRYNAFDDMGGDLCYAIALLDGYDDGVVINGIHGREGSYTYAKPIEKGKSSYTLSAEEEQAIKLAKLNKEKK
ncbi:DUF4446 family protein [Defluviitalea phaphyphila]|uniref:DUF4446 family protein n=1 Tax=Defluviitalea phaphyphila TaxID=1473580 RepID=UPI00073154D0|nr:DUF4446 family protein [Defluviitalea phaphyphila]